MTHRMPPRAQLGKRLLATTSALALAVGIGTAAHAGNVTNPNPIPNPTVTAGQTVSANDAPTLARSSRY